MRRGSFEIDMTNGPLVGKIIRFAIPLALSGILQLLFNAADIIVVGQFVGPQALAAVGSTRPPCLSASSPGLSSSLWALACPGLCWS